MTGVFLFSGRNVSRALWKAEKWGREFENKKWREVKKSLNELKHRGLVSLTFKSDGIFEARITKKGKEIVRKIDFDDLQIIKPNRWDERWRMVIFDIPNKMHKHRLALTQKLRNLGFQMIQKSVWVHPYPCDEEIMVVRKFYNVDPYVTYIETAHVEDEDVWREKFDLEFKRR